MKESKKILMVGNWKMNPLSEKMAKQIFSSIKKIASKLPGLETVICPPFIYMGQLKSSGHRLVIGAQDLFWESDGASTGNISYLQLKNLGIRYAIIGHSERRMMGETNEIVNKKVKASLQALVTPIICIGENKRDEKGEYLKFVRTEIEEALLGVSKTSMKDIVIAYEPLWAIGLDAKREATPQEVFEIAIYIKKVLSDIYETKSVPPTRILYGGSVNEKNVGTFIQSAGVDGFLIGRASLDPKKFNEVLKLASSTKK